MELLLSRIRILAMERFVSEREIDDEIHRLINKFENVIFKKSMEEVNE